MTRFLAASALVAGAALLALTPLLQAQPNPAKGSGGDSGYADKPTQEQIAFFEKKIRPVLTESCYKCHSAEAEKIKGGLTLDTREGIRKGGESGFVIQPGSPEKADSSRR